MTKTTGSKALGIFLAVALVLGFSLVPAVPAEAANPVVQVTNVVDDQDTAFQTAVDTIGTLGATQNADTAVAAANITGESAVGAQGSDMKYSSSPGEVTIYIPSAPEETVGFGQLSVDIDGNGTPEDIWYQVVDTNTDAAAGTNSDVTSDNDAENVYIDTDGDKDLAEEMMLVDSDTFTVTAGFEFELTIPAIDVTVDDDTEDVKVAAQTLYAGTIPFDWDADGTPDTVQVVLVDTNSDGLYEALDVDAKPLSGATECT